MNDTPRATCAYRVSCEYKNHNRQLLVPKFMLVFTKAKVYLHVLVVVSTRAYAVTAEKAMENSGSSCIDSTG